MSKAKPDDVVALADDQHGVVVAVRKKMNRRYLVVRTDAQGRNPTGKPIALKSTDIQPTGRTSRTPGRAYRRSLKIKDRDCNCACCPHTRRPFSYLPTEPTLVDKDAHLHGRLEAGDHVRIKRVIQKAGYRKFVEREETVAEAIVRSAAEGAVVFDWQEVTGSDS